MVKQKIRVIGVVGQNGTGKDEVLKYLKSKFGVPFIATGDIVREIAAREGKEPTRENLGEISGRYFKEFGKGCFVKMVADKIRQSGWKTAGIGGIRTPEDVQILKDTFGKDFILVRVFVSDPEVRYNRMTKRGEGRDPKSFEQFQLQDKAEEERFFIKETEDKADFAIANDGTPTDLHREIDKLVTENHLLEG